MIFQTYIEPQKAHVGSLRLEVQTSVFCPLELIGAYSSAG